VNTTLSSPPWLCIAGYRFVDVDDPTALAAALESAAAEHGLRGTVLVAQEGLNFMLAGPGEAPERWLQVLRADARFTDVPVHRGEADSPPFGHLRVKVKREIIRMDQPTVRPGGGRAAAVDAATLERWIAQGRCDEGRPLALLDTRNAWEVDAGAFDGALDWRLDRFGDFPQALQAHAEALRGHTVVSYCTGGIRCEKAALWMQAQGVEHVHQLDGGILGYFRATAGAPGWRGRCVVFDERGTVGPADAQPSTPAHADTAP
jgi:UPF0176 protein